ncbi:MAG: endonuclease/exonuclease/phosphatase family protein, partial [Acidimicrobiia bacterium]|nr:endonuclease/exonuclease/phosphatase family protein [Acidimicrobiia bacterium]
GRFGVRTVAAIAIASAGLLLPSSALVAPAEAEPAAPDVHIVNLNLLHGTFCPPETDGCQAPDRVELLARQLEDATCPDIVGLQEINQDLARLLNERRTTLCHGDYQVLFGGKPGSLDTERVLTTLPVKSTKVIKLTGGFRTASRAVLRSPLGPLVIVVTHQDGDPETPTVTTCKTCRPPCSRDASVFQCQTTAAAGLAEEAGGTNAIRILMGDFNVTATSTRYRSLIDAGWVDSHLAAGNDDCDPATGSNCTSGRDDKSVGALKDPNARESERIDFIFVKTPQRCPGTFDPVTDDDGDFLGTGLFKATPAVDGPGGLAWPSDHTPVAADLTCAST